MKVTLAFWNEAKKKNGKGAPTVGMTPVLKEFDKAVEALEKTKTLENLNKARAALGKVEVARKKAITTLEDKKLNSAVSLALIGRKSLLYNLLSAAGCR